MVVVVRVVAVVGVVVVVVVVLVVVVLVVVVLVVVVLVVVVVVVVVVQRYSVRTAAGPRTTSLAIFHTRCYQPNSNRCIVYICPEIQAFEEKMRL